MIKNDYIQISMLMVNLHSKKNKIPKCECSSKKICLLQRKELKRGRVKIHQIWDRDTILGYLYVHIFHKSIVIPFSITLHLPSQNMEFIQE